MATSRKHVNAPRPDPDAAYYPLTLFDSMQQNIHMAKAWIVEGAVDVDQIRLSLDRVVEKWRMLAGRVEAVGRQRFRIQIPLGELPPGYKSYNFIACDSDLPLSHYIPLPLPTISEIAPAHLFISDEVKRNKLDTLEEYSKKDAPLTHWKITRFTQKGEEYSCIGMQYCHGLFDGVGSAFILHALAAELIGKEWTVPLPGPSLGPGLHENSLQKLMEKVDADSDRARCNNDISSEDPTRRFVALGAGGILKGLYTFLSMLFTMWIYGGKQYCIVLPYQVHTKVAEDVRQQAKEAGLTDARPGTGDILFSWFMQTIYEDGTNSRRTIGFWSQATLRTEWNDQIESYPHNCNIAQSLPLFTAGEARATPLHKLAHKLARGRLETPRLDDAAAYWKVLKQADAIRPIGYILPLGAADDTLLASNVSVARVVDVDFSPAGGGKVLTQYVFGENALGMPPSLKFMVIVGRLANGDLVLNCWLTSRRGKILEAAVKKLVERYS